MPLAEMPDRGHQATSFEKKVVGIVKLKGLYQLAHAISAEEIIAKTFISKGVADIEKLDEKEIKELIHLLKQIIKRRG